MNKESRGTILRHLGEARIRPYMHETGGNAKYTLSLYIWPVRLNAAVQETIVIMEVILRN